MRLDGENDSEATQRVCLRMGETVSSSQAARFSAIFLTRLRLKRPVEPQTPSPTTTRSINGSYKRNFLLTSLDLSCIICGPPPKVKSCVPLEPPPRVLQIYPTSLLPIAQSLSGFDSISIDGRVVLLRGEVRLDVEVRVPRLGKFVVIGFWKSLLRYGGIVAPGTTSQARMRESVLRCSPERGPSKRAGPQDFFRRHVRCEMWRISESQRPIGIPRRKRSTIIWIMLLLILLFFLFFRNGWRRYSSQGNHRLSWRIVR